MSEKETLIAKLKNVGQPMFLIKISQDVRRFLNAHQVRFPQTGDFDRVYLDVSGAAFEIYEAGVSELEVMPEKGSLIRVSREALIEVAELLHIEMDRENDDELLSSLLNALRNSKSIKQYKAILAILDDAFETNLKMRDFAKIVINQLG